MHTVLLDPSILITLRNQLGISMHGAPKANFPCFSTTDTALSMACLREKRCYYYHLYKHIGLSKLRQSLGRWGLCLMRLLFRQEKIRRWVCGAEDALGLALSAS